MSERPPAQPPTAFLPGLRVGDALAAFWLRNVTWRLRREVCWLWRERGGLASEDGQTLPPFTNRLESSLDLTRHAGQKSSFFLEDETAAYLSQLIAESPDHTRAPVVRGSFSWVARNLKLSDLDCFALALALGPVVDCAAGPVYAACVNDAAKPFPTLGLAQRLWDRPEELLRLADPAWPLATRGLVTLAGGHHVWDAPLHVHPLVARALLWPSEEDSFAGLTPGKPDRDLLPPDSAFAVASLRRPETSGVRVLPIVGGRGAPLAEVAAALAAEADGRVVSLKTPPGEGQLPAILSWCWLKGLALYLDGESFLSCCADGHQTAVPPFPLPIPVTIFLGLQDRAALKRLPGACLLPAVSLPSSSYRQRVDWWTDNLPNARRNASLEPVIAEAARRFRCERDTILGICQDMKSLGRPVRPDDLIQACRSDLDLGELAQPVTPRFVESDLMLPAKQAAQMRELLQAMRALTTVHYEWGAERAWNESGLSALFAGPPGTGKTMAAEVIAAELCLPLFRIDLSQVVNKYIGETEKNLRRLFDAAEASDVILFFDEADSLFGKRTEVKDAHDRYANLEVSYLLERMERFKGLAILATNRKKDLDEAFLRRLRFLIDFPLPGEEERLRIWRAVTPKDVDVSEVDFDFLARGFPLAGGHIRSIVFQACLQSAKPRGPRRLTMEALIGAVKREYDQLDRSISLEKFGPYAAIAQRML